MLPWSGKWGARRSGWGNRRTPTGGDDRQPLNQSSRGLPMRLMSGTRAVACITRFLVVVLSRVARRWDRLG
eukprot:1063811-Pyramimonas_sp.AAC.1